MERDSKQAAPLRSSNAAGPKCATASLLVSQARTARTWLHAASVTSLYIPPAIGYCALGLHTDAYRLRHRWATTVLSALGIALRVDDRSGAPTRPGCGTLYVFLNQTTLLAMPILSAALPPHATVINVEFAMLPLVGWLCVAQRGIVIVRQRPAQSKAALSRAVDRLRAGESLGISIEGQRSRDGNLSPFKKGPAVLAIDAGADIVPIMMHGEYERWPRGTFGVRPGTVDCVLHERISTSSLRYSDRDALVLQLRGLAERERQHRRVEEIPDVGDTVAQRPPGPRATE